MPPAVQQIAQPVDGMHVPQSPLQPGVLREVAAHLLVERIAVGVHLRRAREVEILRHDGQQHDGGLNRPHAMHQRVVHVLDAVGRHAEVVYAIAPPCLRVGVKFILQHATERVIVVLHALAERHGIAQHRDADFVRRMGCRNFVPHGATQAQIVGIHHRQPAAFRAGEVGFVDEGNLPVFRARLIDRIVQIMLRIPPPPYHNLQQNSGDDRHPQQKQNPPHHPANETLPGFS